GIMKAHGGFLQVQSELGRGTEFSLYLPSVAGTVETPVVAAKAELPRGNGETVLVIDDEPAVREVVRSLLKIYGYAPLVAEDGASGIALFREQQSNVAVVVTDMMLPGIQGPEVIRELRSINPDVRVVAMSGVISERGEISED